MAFKRIELGSWQNSFDTPTIIMQDIDGCPTLDALERFDKIMAEQVDRKVSAVVVKYFGRTVKAKSGKSSWRTVGHAKSALRPTFEDAFRRSFTRGSTYTTYRNIKTGQVLDNREYKRKMNEFIKYVFEHILVFQEVE